MDIILKFIVNYYGWFIFITCLLILALIGYFVEQRKIKNNPYKIEKKEEINLEALNNNANESLQAILDKNKIKTDNSSKNLETL